MDSEQVSPEEPFTVQSLHSLSMLSNPRLTRAQVGMVLGAPVTQGILLCVLPCSCSWYLAGPQLSAKDDAEADSVVLWFQQV